MRTMKSLLKKFISRAVGNDRLWRLLDKTFLQAARYAEWERQKNQPDARQIELRRAIETHFPDLTIRRGPFRGMKYEENEPTTGYLLPKLIGSYERELHPLFEE